MNKSGDSCDSEGEMPIHQCKSGVSELIQVGVSGLQSGVMLFINKRNQKGNDSEFTKNSGSASKEIES